VWTEEYEKDVQELKELVKRLEEQQDDADEK
jgi:exonuclease VII small subunit